MEGNVQERLLTPMQLGILQSMLAYSTLGEDQRDILIDEISNATKGDFESLYTYLEMHMQDPITEIGNYKVKDIYVKLDKLGCSW